MKEEEWLEKCTDFAHTVIAKHHMEYDRSNRFPQKIHDEAYAWNLLNQDLPHHLGGGGIKNTSIVKGAEILAGVCAPSAFTLGFNRGALGPLLIGGTAEQQEQWIPPLIQNKGYASFCLTEADNSGSNLMGIQCTAKRTPSGWCINGEKVMVGNGGVAQLFLVLAQLEHNNKKEGLSFFIIPKDHTISVSANTDKIGFRAVETPTVSFNNTEVLEEQRIQGNMNIVLESLANIRVGGASIILGIVSGAIQDALVWTQERNVFGGKLIHKSHVQLLLGEYYARLCSCRALIEIAAQKRHNKEPYGKIASIAKLQASELAIEATTQISQLFGWRGIDGQYPIQKRLRDAKQTAIFEGSSEIQKLNLFHELYRSFRTTGIF